MFSIAAINDTDSRNLWQPLAPTKEAQEFRLSQLYHDGLLRLQAKDYGKARELLESVLHDPLTSNAQVENNASGGHLLQLRFLALKNLGMVFLQLGPTYYESALRCYLQAVDIDGKDSVLWNQLGTLSCLMGSLSISRWAFEQGLVCSPSNWNCMEKLLEVLISIGDEVACLSVSKLILRHWPSHSRALHVKNTIEESEPIPFTPRGVDKLQPKHARLKFPEKRKASDGELDNTTASKRLKQRIEVQPFETSWIALACELLEILLPLSIPSSEPTIERQKSGDIRVSIQSPSSSAKVTSFIEMKGFACKSGGAGMPVVDHSSTNDKEGTVLEEQPQERRSSRLERLRTRKPEKEEIEFSTNKDLAKVVKQYLVLYLVNRASTINCKHNSKFSLDCSEEASNLLDSESADVIAFVQSTYNNCGAYHMSHLLLKKIANRGICYQDTIVKLLDLEKLTRLWGQERTPECSLFLSEVYYDIGLMSSETSKKSSFMSEASYHLCKIIESVAMEFPFHITGMDEKENCNMTDASEKNHITVMDNNSLSNYNHCFWIRFFWLSARLSQLEGDEVKAQRELSVVSSLFMDKDKMNCPPVSICLLHCKANKKLSIDRVLHEINLIEVNYLLKKSVSYVLEKNMHAECVDLLAPLRLSVNDVHFDVLCASGHEGRGFISIELSALDVLIKSCELAEQMYVDVYLGCHRRKLQILLARAGLEGSSIDNHAFSFSESQSNESLWQQWNHSVAEEVKAISQSASKIKSNINPIDFIILVLQKFFMFQIGWKRGTFDGLKKWLIFVYFTLSCTTSIHGSGIGRKVLRVSEELFREMLPLQNGARLYQLQGLRPHTWYEVKISYPASVPSAFTLQLSRGIPDLTRNRVRKLLNTEKLIFKTDGMISSSDQSEMSVLVNVEPEGFVAMPGRREQEYVVFNIVCDELLLGIPHQAWYVVVLALFCLTFAFAVPSCLPPFFMPRNGTRATITKLS